MDAGQRGVGGVVPRGGAPGHLGRLRSALRAGRCERRARRAARKDARGESEQHVAARGEVARCVSRGVLRPRPKVDIPPRARRRGSFLPTTTTPKRSRARRTRPSPRGGLRTRHRRRQKTYRRCTRHRRCSRSTSARRRRGKPRGRRARRIPRGRRGPFPAGTASAAPKRSRGRTVRLAGWTTAAAAAGPGRSMATRACRRTPSSGGAAGRAWT